jgi:hypothetical protein
MAKSKTTKIARKRPIRPPVPQPEPDMRMELAVMPATFAGMLRANIKIRRILKLPPWLQFPLLSQRRDQAVLSEMEHERFLCASIKETWDIRPAGRHSCPAPPDAPHIGTCLGTGLLPKLEQALQPFTLMRRCYWDDAGGEQVWPG